ncbi:hypothetical protein FQN52_007375 [Onygenales sp. PD_12]|nr:hypothetical protein FQN52_007375 [Onygenales sp. PD_12]
MDTHLLTPLSTLETKLNNLLMSIISSPTAAGAPAAALALLEADDALSSALTTLHTHQANYAKILRLRAEATALEERVREIVREIEGVRSEIDVACGGEGGSESDSESESEDGDEEQNDGERDIDADTRMGGVSSAGARARAPRNEVDYKLLLDFARRISRYNSEAAADAAAGIPADADGQQQQQQQQQQQRRVGTSDTQEKEKEKEKEQPTGVGVAALSQETVSWLDETANWSRDLSKMAYPSEDRIRMGVMGQLQAAAGDGVDAEAEIERMMRAEQGGGGGGGGEVGVGEQGAMDEVVGIGEEPVSGAGQGHAQGQMGGVGRDTAMGGMGGGGGGGGPAKPKPKPMLDLDLYDPDEDD